MLSKKAFLSSAIAAGAALLAAPAVMAHGTTESCTASRWTITIESPPCPVSDPNSPSCTSQGDFTGIQYKLTGAAADHVSTLVTRNNVVYEATGNQVFTDCKKGDTVTGLGKYSCH